MVRQCFTWIAHLMHELIGLFSRSYGKVNESIGRFSSSSRKGGVRDLSDDIVVDILSRLPAECVIICGSVCTRWKSLTSTKHFIQLHLSRATPAIFVQSKHYPCRGERELRFFVYDSTFPERKKMRKLPEITKDTEDFTEVVIGSCDGLLLFSDVDRKGYCHVFNPITQEHTSIGFPAQGSANGYLPARGYVCGFFRHPMSNEYKLLFYGLHNGCKQYFVYTLGGSFWTKINHPPFPYQPTNGKTAPPAICNGALHWISRYDCSVVSPCASAIMTFDMLTEQFQTLPHPGNECNGSGRYGIDRHLKMGLLEANEQLSFYYLDEKEKFIDIWMLEKYSTWGWVKKWKLNLNLAQRPDEFYSGTIRHVVVAQIRDRQLWLDCDHEGLFLYQLDQNSVTKLGAPAISEKGFSRHRCIVFTRNLVHHKLTQVATNI